MPSTSSTCDGTQPIRQRVMAADGAAIGSSSRLRQCRSSSAIVPLSSAASCNRRVAVRVTRPTSPTTAASPPWRSPSSTTGSRSSSLRQSAWSNWSGISPTCASPGANRSRRPDTHSTLADVPARFRASPALNSVAAATAPR